MTSTASPRSGYRRSVNAICAIVMALGLSSIASAQPEGPSGQGDVALGESYGDWQMVCRSDATEGANLPDAGCVLVQQVSISNEESEGEGQPFMQVRMLYVPDQEDPVIQIGLPLGIHLPNGVVINVDENEAFRVPFQVCNRQGGCQAIFQLTQQILPQFRAGSRANVRVVAAANQSVVPVWFSLSGFTAGLEALQERRQ